MFFKAYFAMILAAVAGFWFALACDLVRTAWLKRKGEQERRDAEKKATKAMRENAMWDNRK